MGSQARTHDETAAATPFGELLRGYRVRAGLSQQALAELAGLSVEGVGALERGSRRRPYPYTVRALATALGLTTSEQAAFIAAVPSADAGSAPPQPAPTAQHFAKRGGELPTPPTLIVGREREEAAIVRLLERPDVHLLTLTGPGGVGKTRLAVQVAASLSNRLGDACFVDLAAIRDPELVPSAIAHALGLRERGGLGPLENLAAALASQPHLLLLDNFEQVIEGAPAVAELLARCPMLKLLVTSRAPLRVRGEREYGVRPFAVPEAKREVLVSDLLGYPAIRLFVERAQSVDPHFVLTTASAPGVCAGIVGIRRRGHDWPSGH